MKTLVKIRVAHHAGKFIIIFELKNREFENCMVFCLFQMIDLVLGHSRHVAAVIRHQTSIVEPILDRVPNHVLDPDLAVVLDQTTKNGTLDIHACELLFRISVFNDERQCRI